MADRCKQLDIWRKLVSHLDLASTPPFSCHQGAQDVETTEIEGKRFIFFANQMDNTGNVDIYSTIYVENRSPGPGAPEPFVMFQRIGTHGARDMEYFSFGGHHYLAVANEYTQVKSFDSSTGMVRLFWCCKYAEYFIGKKTRRKVCKILAND